MRQFQELYTSVTGQYMDRNDSKAVYKVRLPPATSFRRRIHRQAR
jgi:hypothetical protein